MGGRVEAPGRAPGPRGHWLLGHLREFRRDVLGLMLRSREAYGDVVRFRLGPALIHLVAHPDAVRRVLVARSQAYDKTTRSSAKISSISGEGLLTASGEPWRRKRRLMQPAFAREKIAGFDGIMTGAAREMIDRWRDRARSGEPIDVASEMMRLTFTIVGRALFSSDVEAGVEEVERSMAVLLEHAYGRLARVLDLPLWIPTPGNLRFRGARRAVDGVVGRIIAERRQGRRDREDLLARLLRESDEETGGPLSPRELRDEAVTILLAGHETTANALAWVWYLLARDQEAAGRLRAEAEAVLGDRPPAFEDLPRLEHTGRVIQEAMRLYPPIWAMERRALEDDEIAGYRIPRGSAVVVSPYVTHRHPEFWVEPERFDPDRFRPERFTARQAQAYLPFGSGPRLCIGSHFALAEAHIITVMVARAFRLRLLPGFPVEPRPGITLRARYGLRMTLETWGTGPRS